jgi:glycosyltransferase involved in cell wall biosynthesis
MKKKILLCNEFSGLNTGYATYGKQLLTRLHKTGKYELAEFATYATVKEVLNAKLPWKAYANMPDERSEEYKVYKQDDGNQFGKWRFERVLLDFKPDIVIDIRDFWMMTHEYLSPYRPFYHWMIMPPVDSTPLREEWVIMSQNADSLMAYCNWASKEYDKATSGRLKTREVTPYGLDFDQFRPAQNKHLLKTNMGLPTNSYVVGTVMRNQIRKLYPELLQAFAKLINEAPTEIADKLILYIHSSYPDKKAWEIPSLLKENGLTNKVYFSYRCSECFHTSTSLFKDARTRCKACGKMSNKLPTVKDGFTQEELIKVYQSFDLYVQYSNCEGFGMPILEAAGCGVPVVVTDNSAMTDLANNLNGYRIAVKAWDRLIESNVSRAIPDQDSFVKHVLNYFKKSDSERAYKEQSSRKLAMKHYDWDAIVKKWEKAIDEASPAKLAWDSEPRLFDLKPIPDNLSNKEFIGYLFRNILNEPENEFSYMAAELVRDLNYGVTINNNKIFEINRHKIGNGILSIANNKLNAEKARCGLLPLNNPDFIQAANQ